MLEKIQIALQYLLPKLWITKCIGWIAERNLGWLTQWIIALFILRYNIDMQEAKQPEIVAYRTFNAFFVRALRKDARPIDDDSTVIVFPADGMLSQLGSIAGEKIFQAKGHFYSLKSLLAGNEEIIKHFRDGRFVTTYLSPRDYHHVHMPCNGMLRQMLYVPGALFSVHPLTVAHIPNLFSRNERVICFFDTDFGPMVQILLGATIVGSIETVCAGTIIPPRKKIIQHWCYPCSNSKEEKIFEKGQEMGRFKLGSTVINLFSANQVFLDEDLAIRYVTRVGQRLGYGIARNENRLSI